MMKNNSMATMNHLVRVICCSTSRVLVSQQNYANFLKKEVAVSVYLCFRVTLP